VAFSKLLSGTAVLGKVLSRRKAGSMEQMLVKDSAEVGLKHERSLYGAQQGACHAGWDHCGGGM
jgi:hypothetical protein